MRLRPFFVQAGDVATAQQWREAAISETARPVIVRSLLDGPSLCWRGEITAANADRVWAATQPLIRAAPGEMFIDLAGVRFMDSSGAGIMRRARMLADRRRMKLVFYHPPEAVQDVLRYSRLDTLLAESVPDEPVRLSTQDGLLASQHS
jgi:anti-anti-sigma factor